MSDELTTLQARNSDLTTQAQTMAEALYAVAMEADEGQCVRAAFLALLATEVGAQHLRQNVC